MDKMTSGTSRAERSSEATMKISDGSPPPTGAALIQSSSRYLSALRSPRLLSAFVLVVAYSIVSAATFQGFYGKFTMYDGHSGQSLVSMLDGTGHRPYVFRQLLPQFANIIERSLPEGVARAAEERLLWANQGLRSPKGSDATKTGYVLRYRIVYYATSLCLFLSLFVLRSLCLTAGFDRMSASVAPAMFALTVPILQTNGGFFYDLPEILAFALAARLALSGQVLGLLLLAAPATANKESFFFYCLTLFPLLRQRLAPRVAVSAIAAALLISGTCYYVIKSVYAGNPGSDTILQLSENVLFYINPLNLLRMDQTYGLPFFKAYGLVMLCWFATLMTYGWSVAPNCVRQHLILAAIVNVPLFLMFCAAGEMRNLSMLYVGTVILMAGALHRWIRTENPT